jgi:hypothetical protein
MHLHDTLSVLGGVEDKLGSGRSGGVGIDLLDFL